MTSRCALEPALRPGGPVRVPFRPCCVAVLIEQRDVSSGTSSGRHWFCPATDLLPPLTAGASASLSGAVR
jgi:hypothetical protein